MASAAVTPRVRAMLVCQGIRRSNLEDAAYDLKCVHYALKAASFSHVPSRLWLFLVLSSPRNGRFPGGVSIVNDRTNRANTAAAHDRSKREQQCDRAKRYDQAAQCVAPVDCGCGEAFAQQ